MSAAIRAGDHVFHGPTGETWVVRRVVGDRLEWFGWPPGQAELVNCAKVYACTEEEHREALRGHVVRHYPSSASAESAP